MQLSILRYFLISTFFIGISIVAAAQESLVVIGNGKGAPTELNMGQLKAILKGEKQRWNDGTKVAIALMKTNTPVGSSTSKKVFNMSGDQLNKHWLSLVFQGKADAPSFFNSMNELEAYVVQTPGAIGIIGQPPTIASKTILVDGKRML